MFYSRLIALALYALPALAAPFPLLRISRAATPPPGRYIVTLKQGEETTSTADDVKTFSSTVLSSSSNITHQWESMGAFAGEISNDDLETLRADPRVEAIEEDGIMKAFANVTQYGPPLSDPPVMGTDISRNSIRDNAPWGLSRISSQTKLASQNDRGLNFTYSFDSTAGAGSTVYIIGGSKFPPCLVYGTPYQSLKILVSLSIIQNLKVVPASEPPCKFHPRGFRSTTEISDILP